MTKSYHSTNFVSVLQKKLKLNDAKNVWNSVIGLTNVKTKESMYIGILELKHLKENYKKMPNKNRGLKIRITMVPNLTTKF